MVPVFSYTRCLFLSEPAEAITSWKLTQMLSLVNRNVQGRNKGFVGIFGEMMPAKVWRHNNGRTSACALDREVVRCCSYTDLAKAAIDWLRQRSEADRESAVRRARRRRQLSVRATIRPVQITGGVTHAQGFVPALR